MIIQITATNLATGRLLIAEVETQRAIARPRKFAQIQLRIWHAESPSDRVYQLETVEIIR